MKGIVRIFQEAVKGIDWEAMQEEADLEALEAMAKDSEVLLLEA